MKLGKGRRFLAGIALAALMVCSLGACGEKGPKWLSKEVEVIDDNYRTWYEIFVGSFYDSDKDEMGDLQGVISKLDYCGHGIQRNLADAHHALTVLPQI